MGVSSRTPVPAGPMPRCSRLLRAVLQASRGIPGDGDPPPLTRGRAVSLWPAGLSSMAAAYGSTGHRLRPDHH